MHLGYNLIGSQNFTARSIHILRARQIVLREQGDIKTTVLKGKITKTDVMQNMVHW